MIAAYSPAAWNTFWWGGSVAVDRCVNEGAERADGSECRDRAEANGWCKRCWAEIVPLPTSASS